MTLPPSPLSADAVNTAWLEVNVGAIRRNAAALARFSGAALLPMVKADAYGLGAVAVARALEALEPWGLGVATLAEGVELRQAGITRRIVLFNPMLTGEFGAAAAAGLTPSLGDGQSIDAWKMYGLPYHLSIDTGMSRAGADWRAVSSMHQSLRNNPPEGAFTHFHSAQVHDRSIDIQQQRFTDTVAGLPARPRFLHTEASAAIVRQGESRWDVVRPGIFLYGVSTSDSPAITPEPVVNLHARVVETRWIEAGDTVSYDCTFVADSRRRIATVAMGYADGYPRALGNTGEAILRTVRARIAGRVTMDMTMLDVTDVDCTVGDTATFVGQAGNTSGEITVGELAERASMSPYEVLTGFRSRIERVYRDV